LYSIDINGREQPEEEVDEEANVILPNGGRIDSNVPMQNGWCCEEDFKFADVQPFSGIGIEGVKDIPPETNTPFKFWSLLITVQMILDIVKWTNEYARKWKDATIDQIYDPANPQKNMFPKKPKWLLRGKWKDVSESEIRCFIAIQFIMSFVKLPNLKAYWNGSLKYFKVFNVQSIMSRTRFSRIKSCFHICEPVNGMESASDDKLLKVRSFMDTFLENCKRYYQPHEIISVDEMMVRFSGKNEFIFSQQPKPTPNGFKLIGSADAKTAYTYSFIVDIREQNKKKFQYVLQLADELKETYHTLVMDRAYSTLDLFSQLLDKKIYAVGTIKKYKNIPS
jgi:hypothetical protein